MSARAFNAALYVRHLKNTYDFVRAHGSLPDYVEPRSFYEKIQWRKLFDRNPLFPIFVDKLAVRCYVAHRAPAVRFPRLLWSGTDPEAIPYEDLPERFVLKPSHRSGDALFIRSRTERDRERIATSCRRWLRRPYGRGRREWAYQGLEGRLIVEEMLRTAPDPAYSRDFRCHVVGGAVVATLVNLGRVTDMTHRFVGKAPVFDRSWNRLPYCHRFDPLTAHADLGPPDALDRIVAAAESVGHGLDYVRFDCFLVGSDVYFSEVTVYPGSGMNTVEVDLAVGSPETEPFGIYLGSKWTLPAVSLRDRLKRGLLHRWPAGTREASC